MGIIAWIVWGLFVGAFARLLVPGRQGIGIIRTILLGVVGSVLGGLLATKVLKIGNTDKFDFGSFAIAVVVSALLLVVVERVTHSASDRGRDGGARLRGRR